MCPRIDRSHPHIRLFLYPRGGINEPRDRLSARTGTPSTGEETGTQFPSALFIRKPWNAKFPAERAGEPRVSLSAITRFPRASSIRGWRWIMHPSPLRDQHPPFYAIQSHRPLIVFRYATVRIRARNDLRLSSLSPFHLDRLIIK